MTCGIYMIRNKDNGRCYIGSSWNIEQRFNQRWTPNQFHNPLFQQDWAILGREGFVQTVLEEVPIDRSMKYLLTKAEKKWIKTLHPAYNVKK